MTTISIRHTQVADMPALLGIYENARAFMRRTGNQHQWVDGYPSLATIKSDLAQGGSYVCVCDDRVVGTFFFKIGDDPTYAAIRDGEWLNHNPYGVIHRVASDGSVKGLMHRVLDFCFGKIGTIRIDTHRDNQVMQRSLAAYGFAYCGIINIANGDERLAYQKTLFVNK